MISLPARAAAPVQQRDAEGNLYEWDPETNRWEPLDVGEEEDLKDPAMIELDERGFTTDDESALAAYQSFVATSASNNSELELVVQQFGDRYWAHLSLETAEGDPGTQFIQVFGAFIPQGSDVWDDSPEAMARLVGYWLQGVDIRSEQHPVPWRVPPAIATLSQRLGMTVAGVPIDPGHGLGHDLWTIALFPTTPEAELMPDVEDYLGDVIGAHRLGSALWVCIMTATAGPPPAAWPTPPE